MSENYELTNLGATEYGALVLKAKANEWQPIETVPVDARKVVVLISTAGPNGYVTDPWTGWANSDGTFARWPHDFPPTHWMPLPAPPKAAIDAAMEAAK